MIFDITVCTKVDVVYSPVAAVPVPVLVLSPVTAVPGNVLLIGVVVDVDVVILVPAFK